LEKDFLKDHTKITSSHEKFLGIKVSSSNRDDFNNLTKEVHFSDIGVIFREFYTKFIHCLKWMY